MPPSTVRFDLAAWGAELTPDQAAIWFNGRWYTYRDLNERANSLANHLSAMGVGFGDRIGLLAANHLAHFDLMLAAPKLGFIYVPFNPRLPVSDLQTAGRLVKPALVISDLGCETLAARAFSCPRIDLEEYRGWLGSSSRHPIAAPELSTQSSHMILFTAGYSGHCRPVLIPYRQTLANARGTAMCWELGMEDCTIQVTPCSQAAINVLSTPLLAVGGRVVLMSRFDLGEFFELAQRFKASVIFMYPSMYRAMVAHPRFGAVDLSHLRWAICGGESCPSSLTQGFGEQGLLLKQGYGMTEAGINCFSISEHDAKAHPDSVGRPLAHVDVKIRREDGTVCAEGEVGELTLAGEAVCSGYFEPTEDWQRAYRDGWLWTGDLAERDAHGLHYIRGRLQDVYHVGGRVVIPDQVEQQINRCDGVAECAVIGMSGGESSLAVVVLQTGIVMTAAELRAQLQTRIAPYKVPSVFVFVEALPRTATGRIDKAVMRTWLEQGQAMDMEIPGRGASTKGDPPALPGRQ